jgi:hypothetical protein
VIQICLNQIKIVDESEMKIWKFRKSWLIVNL